MKPINNKWYYTQYPGAHSKVCRCIEAGEHASDMQCIGTMYKHTRIINNCILLEVDDPRPIQRFIKKIKVILDKLKDML